MNSGITLYIATSVDGYVADADGIDWLEEFQTESDGEGYAERSSVGDC